MEFYNHILVLIGIIVAMTAFKVVSCKPFKEDGEEFAWKKLLLGLAGNLIVLGSLSATYYCGVVFGSDLVVVSLGTTDLTIPAALNVLMLATIGVYGGKLIRNFQLYFGLNKDSKGVSSEIAKTLDDLQTTFNDDVVLEEDEEVIG